MTVPDRINLDPKFEVTVAAERIRDALTRLGLCYNTKNGDLIEISYRQLAVVGEEYGVLEVDTQRLPPRVSISKLTHPNTIHHLTAVVGKPVRKLNTTGLTYCVELGPHGRRRLPRQVELDLDGCPEGPYMIPIGQNKDESAWKSLLETSHILVGGESRSGKSTWLNAVLVALLSRYQPEELKLALVDPKGVEFTPYDGVPHLVKPVALTPKDASGVTTWLIDEMEQRRTQFAKVFARNLQSFNERAQDINAEQLPLILIVIDEVSDIALQAGLKSVFYKNLIRLASKGAAFGLILILATQNPKAEVLNTLIRGNLSTRIAFRVSTSAHSRTILGRSGAQDLPRTIRGRMLIRMDGALKELQGFWVPDKVVLALTQHWIHGGAPRLNELERELVQYALRKLDGQFPIKRLYEAFRSKISHRQLLKLGRRWEHNGWLSPQSSVVDPRRVTQALIKVAFADDPSRVILPTRSGATDTLV